MIFLPAGRELDLDPRLVALLLGLGQPQAAVAAREERRGDLGEVPLHGVEGLGEAPVDRLGQLVAQLAQLVERALEVLALRAQLRQALLLLRVLLLRERVDAAELLAPPLEPVELLGQLLACPVCRLGAGRVEPPLRLGALRLEPRDLDVDARDPLRRLRVLAPQLDLPAAERAQLGCELAGADGAAVRLREQRRLEPLDRARAPHAIDVDQRRRRGRRAPGRRAAARPARPGAVSAAPPRAAAAAAPPARAAPPRRCRR